MIYKIIMEFKDLDILINKLSKDFNILFYNNCLYICSKNFKKKSLKTIKSILKTDNVFLVDINESNLKNESDYIQSWCKNYFIEKDIKEFEQKEQELLKQYMLCLDDCEKQIQEMIKKGG